MACGLPGIVPDIACNLLQNGVKFVLARWKSMSAHVDAGVMGVLVTLPGTTYGRYMGPGFGWLSQWAVSRLAHWFH